WQQPFLDNPEVPVPREVMRVDFPVIGFFHVGELALDDNGLGLDLHLHEGIMARCGIAFELQSLYGEGVHELVAEGRARTAGATRCRRTGCRPRQGCTGWSCTTARPTGPAAGTGWAGTC